MWTRRLLAAGVLTLLVGAPLGVLSGCGQTGTSAAASRSEGPMRFEVVEQGTYSQYPRESELVVTEQAGWEAFYRQHAPDGEIPRVDFTQSMVVGVVLQRNTGGFQVEVTAVNETADAVVVSYTETRPNSDAVTIQVLTQPFVLVQVPRRDGPVRFEHTVETAPAP